MRLAIPWLCPDCGGRGFYPTEDSPTDRLCDTCVGGEIRRLTDRGADVVEATRAILGVDRRTAWEMHAVWFANEIVDEWVRPVRWEPVPTLTREAPASSPRAAPTMHARCPKCRTDRLVRLDFPGPLAVSYSCECGHVLASTEDGVTWTYSADFITISAEGA